MISRFGEVIARVFRAVMPDPFAIAVTLTLVSALLAYVFGDFGSKVGVEKGLAIVDAWRGPGGLWKLLPFSMLMCLVLVTGHALAESPPVKRLLERLAGVPRTTGQAAAMVCLVGCCAALVNWGLGLVVGAVLAREVGRSFRERGLRLHYPLVAAAGYMGILVWHGGLSGSAPLLMTDPARAAKVLPEATMKQVGATQWAGGIGLDETIFAPFNLVITLGLVVIMPVIFGLLAPRASDSCEGIDRFRPERPPAHSDLDTEPGPLTFPERADRSPVMVWLLAVPLMTAVVRFSVVKSWTDIGLEEFCAAMLALGLVLHGSLRSYARAAEDGARGCAGIILQFPLYGGILAMLDSSGLVARFASVVAGLGGENGVVLATFASSCITNFVVPSGGGQWAVQGPVAIQSGIAANVPLGKMVLAVAYGGELTDLIQPFWALPVLAVTGVRARDIVGYTAAAMIVAAVWMVVWLWLL